jgi:prolyl 4-hydroxylase
LDQRCAKLLGVDPRFSEPIQGQRYDPGQYFKQHTDWFAPGTKEFDQNTSNGGQRTWTVMVYLNAVESGGETLFQHLDQRFTPRPGLGLAWNNLQEDGSPNQYTLHEAMPVDVGGKWVITKWFRERMGRNG